jgi:hypothetical protein
MALPTTVPLQANKRVVGSFKSSAGNYYIFGVDGATATTLQAMKATDPTTSWGSIATKTTGFATSIDGLAGVQNGDTIHMIVSTITTVNTSCSFIYQTFDMSTDTFPLQETIVSAINPSDSGGGLYGLCEVVFRPSDSQPVVQYPGPQVAGFAKVNEKHRTGVATWSTAQVVDAAAASTDYYPMGVAMGGSSTVHFAYLGLGGTPVLNERAMTSANALQTAVAFTPFTANGANPKGNSTVTGSTTKVVFTGNHSTNSNIIAARFDSASVPTISNSSDIGASGTVNIGSRLFVDGNDFWVLYTRSDTGDVYVAVSHDFGATWGAETLAMTATATGSGPNGDEFLSFNGTIYTRGTLRVLAYVVNDAGTLKYNEFIIPDQLMGQGCL